MTRKANPVNLKGFCSRFRQKKKLGSHAPNEIRYFDLSVKQNIEMALQASPCVLKECGWGRRANHVD